jgi:hypothetical protein
MSARYVHPNDDDVFAAMSSPDFSGRSLIGQDFGQGPEMPLPTDGSGKLLDE